MRRDSAEGDFYAVLGVAVEADAAEIQAAYRALARKLHPDVNGDKWATAQFALISEAYTVLGSQTRRSAYDRARREAPSPKPSHKPPSIRLVSCSECGVVTAQPRILVFRTCVGLGVWSRVRRSEGVYCSRCAWRVGRRASVKTALLGWWAVPFGPFLAAWCIGLNAAGGSRRPLSDRRLALLNAQAFLERNNPDLAQALALRVLRGADEAEARKARAIIAQARDRGAKASTVALKNPWKLSWSYIALHIFLLLIGPGAFLSAILLFGGV